MGACCSILERLDCARSLCVCGSSLGIAVLVSTCCLPLLPGNYLYIAMWYIVPTFVSPPCMHTDRVCLAYSEVEDMKCPFNWSHKLLRRRSFLRLGAGEVRVQSAIWWWIMLLVCRCYAKGVELQPAAAHLWHDLSLGYFYLSQVMTH